MIVTLVYSNMDMDILVSYTSDRLIELQRFVTPSSRLWIVNNQRWTSTDWVTRIKEFKSIWIFSIRIAFCAAWIANRLPEDASLVDQSTKVIIIVDYVRPISHTVAAS